MANAGDHLIITDPGGVVAGANHRSEARGAQDVFSALRQETRSISLQPLLSSRSRSAQPLPSVSQLSLALGSPFEVRHEQDVFSAPRQETRSISLQPSRSSRSFSGQPFPSLSPRAEVKGLSRRFAGPALSLPSTSSPASRALPLPPQGSSIADGIARASSSPLPSRPRRTLRRPRRIRAYTGRRVGPGSPKEPPGCVRASSQEAGQLAARRRSRKQTPCRTRPPPNQVLLPRSREASFETAAPPALLQAHTRRSNRRSRREACPKSALLPSERGVPSVEDSRSRRDRSAGPREVAVQAAELRR